MLSFLQRRERAKQSEIERSRAVFQVFVNALRCSRANDERTLPTIVPCFTTIVVVGSRKQSEVVADVVEQLQEDVERLGEGPKHCAEQFEQSPQGAECVAQRYFKVAIQLAQVRKVFFVLVAHRLEHVAVCQQDFGHRV